MFQQINPSKKSDFIDFVITSETMAPNLFV